MPAAPATPAAPAAPAAPATHPSPSRTATAPPPEKDPADWMGDVGTELEQLADETPKPPTQRKPAAKPKEQSEEPPKEQPPQKDVAEVETPPEEKPPETPPEDTSKMGARDLRKAYEGSQKKIREELQPTIAKLQARVKELETAKPEENGALNEKYKAIEKRNQELESHIRFVDYEQSSEYKDKYFKPYVEAWERARADLAELAVELPDGASRQSTDEDIRMLSALPLGERRAKANAMFGDSANDVMDHVKEIKRLSDAQLKALADAKKNALTVSQERQRAMTEARQNRLKLWDQTNKDLAEKYPAWFAPVEGDAEGNKALAAGHALTKVLFAPEDMEKADFDLLPKFARDEVATKGKLSEESTVKLHAIIRNKAAGYDRLARRMKTLRAELEEAKKSLKAYEDSEPPGPGGGSPHAPRSEDHWDTDPNQELDALDRAGR